jgi:hypothetical protein
MSLKILRYSDSFSDEWNQFVEVAKNSVFLFNRNYMDYHKNIFTDHSLLIYNNDELIGLLPCNEKNHIVTSHGGLTFGGLILPAQIKLFQVVEIFKSIVTYYKSNNFIEFIYKPVPSFYHTITAQEDLYVMFLLKAELIRRDTGFVIDREAPIIYQERRKRGIKKAQKLGVQVTNSASLNDFWQSILEPNLMKKFGVRPVHALSEINFLQHPQ